MTQIPPRFLDPAPMNARRDAFYARAREAMFEWVSPDGTPRGPHRVFAGTSAGNVYPNREPFRSEALGFGDVRVAAGGPGNGFCMAVSAPGNLTFSARP